jgi:hypothetical protein
MKMIKPAVVARDDPRTASAFFVSHSEESF